MAAVLGPADRTRGRTAVPERGGRPQSEPAGPALQAASRGAGRRPRADPQGPFGRNGRRQRRLARRPPPDWPRFDVGDFSAVSEVRAGRRLANPPAAEKSIIFRPIRFPTARVCGAAGPPAFRLTRLKWTILRNIGKTRESRHPFSKRSFLMAAVPGRTELGEALRSCRSAFIGVGIMSCMINLLYLTGSIFMLEVYDRVIPSRSVATLVGLVVLC